MEDADNVFGVFYRNKRLKKRANSFHNQDSRLQSRDLESFDSEAPSVEWLPSSGSERDKCDLDGKLGLIRDKEGRIIDNSEILNMTGVRELRHMEQAREKLELRSKMEPGNSQLVLDKQILDIKIEQKIKLVRSSQLQKKAARSHRQDVKQQSMKNPLKNMSPGERSDIKAKSLKNSQVIAESK